MPRRRQPDEAMRHQRSLMRVLARCLLLSGAAVAAWLLASGAASASEPGRDQGVDVASSVLGATGDSVTGLLGVADPASAEALSSPVPAGPDAGALAGVLDGRPEPHVLVGLLDQHDVRPEIPMLDGLRELGRLPRIGEEAGATPVRPVTGQAQGSEPHQPDVTPTPTALSAPSVTAAGSVVVPGTSPATGGATAHGAPVDPVQVPTLPVGGHDTPCPALPGQPSSSQAGASGCAVLPADDHAARTSRQLRAVQGRPAPARAVPAQPGTDPD